MMMYELPFIVILSLLFTQLKHPLSAGFTLLIQTALISIATGLFNYSYWFSYILFLVFLGGMLVLFIYVTSLASNEKFNMKNSFNIILLLTLMIALLMALLDPLVLSNKINIDTSSLLNTHLDLTNAIVTITAIYNSPTASFTLLIISYLLLALLVIVKVMNLSSGPLRMSTYDNTNTKVAPFI
uniref:NADH-ubiquinone oxidoreductase chain 6 n=1 Tax=Clibanarius infraspinatus TaxID=1566627 RepID=A0A0A1IXU0_9EUCA|nr:NADH dehydrogenase subunit 6 [Clibanarius infraspinatus]CEH27546.1 NADH dehydrogenase subunit 6 [Clibanarius infraspinatus]